MFASNLRKSAMPRVLLLSSFVARGGIGLSANIAPLQAAGIVTIPLPTTLLSNNPSYQPVAGAAVAPDAIFAMANALDGNGWLEDVDAILTGYLPSAGHVSAARAIVEKVRERNPRAFYVCDPIAGDDPDGLYIDVAAAGSVRDDLVPLADLVTPNRFELEWLSGRRITDVEGAIAAARQLGPPAVVVTSIPSGEAQLVNVAVSQDGVGIAVVEKRSGVPHGTGDLFAGLLLARLLSGDHLPQALATATDGVGKALAASTGDAELRLAGIDW